MKRTKLKDQVFNAYAESEISISAISRVTDLSRMTISRIISNPEHCNVMSLQMVLKALGYRIEVKKIVEDMDDGIRG